MAGPKDLDPSSSPRALLGAELRHAREATGLSQEELGQSLFVSGSFIGQLEAGTRRVQPDMASKLDDILGTNGFFERNCKAVNRSKYPDHFAEAAEAEAIAGAIREYAPLLIPGLLQTEAYARAVFRAYRPTAKEDVIDGLVAARLERARLLDDPTDPLLWAVLDEAVLRRKVGSAAVMAEVLHRVAALIREHRIIVQVLPFGAGAHASMTGAFKLMDFEDAPTLAFVEGPSTGHLEDDPATVARHQLTHDLLKGTALSPQESLALIESVAQDYEHGEEHP
ncbi:helix-turn-helix transcriptional regulator [Streptomyces sp. ActVer]|uniref:helix-turn-helix domain-containing protein n=1 Tax=Streptomyces sp. ActVer TaxID=3014558 RepID=UPI0022B3EAFB|nr:helix-turn-helix transcriptional regulator [Streptomyces sp. ActVer]MCZ4511805.1 helix-turn-helix transcriptional regulator [Streptomyces sp. ActVer]